MSRLRDLIMTRKSDRCIIPCRSSHIFQPSVLSPKQLRSQPAQCLESRSLRHRREVVGHRVRPRRSSQDSPGVPSVCNIKFPKDEESDEDGAASGHGVDFLLLPDLLVGFPEGGFKSADDETLLRYAPGRRPHVLVIRTLWIWLSSLSGRHQLGTNAFESCLLTGCQLIVIRATSMSCHCITWIACHRSLLAVTAQPAPACPSKTANMV